MKVTFNISELKNAIAKVIRGVSKRSTMPSVEGLAFKTNENRVTISSYNLEMGIATTLDANISSDGEIVINAKLLENIIKKMSGDFVVIESNESNNVVTISSMDSNYSISGIPYKDFPELPDVSNKSDNFINIEEATLKSMISQTLYAISDIDTRPVFTGSLFEVKDGRLRIVSVDGFRLVYRTESIETNKEVSFIVPGKSLIEIEKLLKQTDKKVEIRFSKRHVKFVINDYTVISRLIEGDFMDYERAIPTNSTYEVEAQRKDILNACDRMSLLINDATKTPIKCTFGENKIKFECSAAVGFATDTIAAITPDKNEMVVGFNNRYMIDTFKSVSNDNVKLYFVNPVSPIVVRTDDSDNFLALILPVRIR